MAECSYLQHWQIYPAVISPKPSSSVVQDQKASQDVRANARPQPASLNFNLLMSLVSFPPTQHAKDQQSNLDEKLAAH